MKKSLVAEVSRRAGGVCEYCLLPSWAVKTPHQVDHVLSKKHHGRSGLANLALCCLHCNSFKGPVVAGFDPLMGEVTRLFNPRVDAWESHFIFRGARIVGKTAIGRLTVDVLKMNDEDQIGIRQDLLDLKFTLGPPKGAS